MTAFILFVIGILFGSFANVIVYRIRNQEKGIFFGRSRCPFCKHQLQTIDLIPLISFIFLKGKCRYCKKSISFRYFSGELVMGFLFALVGFYHPISLESNIVSQLPLILTFLLILFVLTIVMYYDFLYMEIPDSVMIPAILFALIISFSDPTLLLRSGSLVFGIESLPLYALIGGLIPFLFFAFQIIISQGAWMGGGDLRIGAFMGIVLGIKLVLVALLISYIIGALFGIFAIIFTKKGMKSQIPFAPFLTIGTIVALFWGEFLVSWYLNFLI